MFANSPLVVESSINDICLVTVTSEVSSLKNINGPEEQSDARRGSLMWSSMIWIYLEMYSGIICVWWCMKEVLFYFSVASSNKLNYWFKIVWVSQIFLYQQPRNSKKASGNKAICSYHRNFFRQSCSSNSFQTSVYHLLRLLKANLLETTSLWCCICKCLLALQVGWSPNVPALLTYSVTVITRGEKVEHVLQYHPFPQLLK